MKFFKAILFLFSLNILNIIGVVEAAYAASIDLNKIEPLYEVEYMPDEEFNEQTDLIKETPYDDKYLSYEVRLPKDWEQVEVKNHSLESGETLSQRVLGPIARYASPVYYLELKPDELPTIENQKPRRNFFTIETLELDYEIGARNWFINYIISNGLSLEQVGEENNNEVEATYLEFQDDTPYVVRVKAILNGPRIVVASYYVPQDSDEVMLLGVDWKRDKYVKQAQVIRSFKLLNREKVGAEKLEIYGFLDQSYFDYPESWQFNPPLIKSIDRMRAMIHHSTSIDKLDGQINIYLTNKLAGTTRAKEIEFYKDKFMIDGYKLGKYIETISMDYHKDMNFGITQAYEMNPIASNMLKYEFLVTLMEGEEYIYILTLLTPARTEEFYTWARNMAAYKLVVRGMRRHDESVDYYRFIQ